MSSLAVTPGCIRGPTDESGPTILSVAPSDGETGVTRVPRFVVSLDRPVGPRGFPTESVLLISGERRVPLRITSDPTTRSFEVVPRSALDPDVGYRLELGAFQDLEGRAAEPLTVHFETGRGAVPDPGPSATWLEAATVLERCAECHSGDTAPLGLDLSSPEGIATTALGVPAREVRAGDPVTVGGGLLGLMRIDPGSPGRSYLIWKLSGDEHVPGDPMPPDEPLSVAEIQVLVGWVRAGAPLE